LIAKVLADEKSLDACVGPQIWVKNEDFFIRTTLWNPQNKKPLWININTASAFDLASFPKISLDKAKQIIKKRTELGYFKSLEQAIAFGFNTSESIHRNKIYSKRITK
jgi:DNA uptake protein ComE-like DNA-binding protein